SQALQADSRWDKLMSTDNTDTWMEIINQSLVNKELNQFDYQEWTPDKILQSLTTDDGLKSLIQYKLSITPIQHTIPQAIALKFKHKDIAFFTTFTRVKCSKLVHQIQYKQL